MFALLFCVWLMLNGRVTLEVCLFGIAVCFAVYWLAVRFVGFSFRKEIRFIRNIPWGIAYFFVLVWEIIKANLAVARVVLSGKKTDPVIVKYKIPLKTEFAKVLLANSITLTPGTITVSVDGDRFCVHALCSEFAEGIDRSVFVSLLKKMEK